MKLIIPNFSPCHSRDPRVKHEDDRWFNFGFTLIELLVVAGIVSLFAALTIPSYISFNRSQEIRQASLNLKNILRDTQNRATSSEKSTTTCTGSDILQGFYVVITPNSSSTSISGRCGLINFNTTSKVFASTSVIQGFYDASSSPCSTITPVQGKVTILFKPLGGGVKFYDGDLDIGTILNISKLALKLTNSTGQTYYIIVESGGDIYEKTSC